jgi:hypothetical protein
MKIVSTQTNKPLLFLGISFMLLLGACSPKAQKAGPTEQGPDTTGEQGTHQGPCPPGQHRFVQPDTGAESCVKDGTVGSNPNQPN